MIKLVLLAFAFVCFCLAAYLTAPKENKLVAAGLAFWIASQIFPT